MAQQTENKRQIQEKKAVTIQYYSIITEVKFVEKNKEIGSQSWKYIC